jgi:F-type H+-transporting ATPase subunit epsilon
VADNTNFELVSPEKLLFSQEVEMVVVPGADGDLGVLAGHAPVISTLRPGTIAVFENGAVSERIFVAGGFAEVTPERCTVLAEEAMPFAEIDRAAVEKMLSDLRDDLSAAQEDTERRTLSARIAVQEAKLSALDTSAYANR